jgi:23S rRNA (adenine2503-C2)-methyltransferase
MKKINLLGFAIADMENLMQELGEKRFKGRQLFKWLCHFNEHNFDRMTDLSLPLRQKLAKKYEFSGLKEEIVRKSVDGTEKYLFTLDDGNHVETVLIPDKGKNTVCLSSQAGCALGCRFCATGLMGFKRNLTCGEIIGQLIFLRQKYGSEAFQNIVFMGMGEPLLNYDNMVAAIEIISSEIGLVHSAKKISVSTVGIVPQIYKLADSDLKVNLAISLHAATDEKRKKIIPIAAKYDLKALMEAVRYFVETKGKRITFEYIIFDGFNDSMDDIKALAGLIRGIPCKINLLAYNPVGVLLYNRPSDEKVNEFGRLLYPRVPAVTVRKSRGLDIEAACGQLAGKQRP